MTYTASTFSGNTSNSTKLSSEFQLIETAMDLRLGRTAAGNNQMLTDIDMNNFALNNVGVVDATSLIIGGVAVLLTTLASPDLVNTDAGSTAGPTLSLYRNSVSAADADFTGEILFDGNDDAATPARVTYAAISSQIDDSSAGTEDATLLLKTMVAGTLTTQLDISSAGLVVAGGVDSLTSATTVVSVAAATAPTSGQVLTATASTTATWQTPAAGGISNVVEDTTPQLGGNLDVNGNSIVSVSAGDIAITPDTTGDLVLDGVNWPQADGSANEILSTDGAGQLSWVSNGAGNNPFTLDSDNNIFAGTNAGNALTSGTDNFLAGVNAGLLITVADDNVVIGNGALDANVSADDNIALGRNSLGALLSGFGGNLGIGAGAGGAITTGVRNVILGTTAAQNLTADSDQNVIIGFQAGPSSSGEINNRLFINNGQNDLPLIHGEFDNSIVTINGTLVATAGVDSLTNAAGNPVVCSSTTPSTGQVLTATSATTATWQTP